MLSGPNKNRNYQKFFGSQWKGTDKVERRIKGGADSNLVPRSPASEEGILSVAFPNFLSSFYRPNPIALSLHKALVKVLSEKYGFDGVEALAFYANASKKGDQGRYPRPLLYAHG